MIKRKLNKYICIYIFLNYIYGLLMEPVKHIHDEEGKLLEVSRAFMLCGPESFIEHKVIL